MKSWMPAILFGVMGTAAIYWWNGRQADWGVERFVEGYDSPQSAQRQAFCSCLKTRARMQLIHVRALYSDTSRLTRTYTRACYVKHLT